MTLSYISARDFRLTGRVRYRHAVERIGRLKRQAVLVAQVEEQFTRYHVGAPDGATRPGSHWRDMRATDLRMLAAAGAADALVAAERGGAAS